MWVLVLVLGSVGVVAGGYDYKRLAGSPSSFGRHRVPGVEGGAVRASGALLGVQLSSSVSRLVVPVDSPRRLTVALFSPLSAHYSALLLLPDGSSAPPVDKQLSSYPLSDSGSSAAPATAWTYEKPPLGNWTLVLSPLPSLPLSFSGEPVEHIHPNCFLLVWNDSEEQIESRLANYELEQDQAVGVVSTILLSSQPNALRKSFSIDSAVLQVMFPDMSHATFPMYDDGKHDDGAANDGVFGGNFNATQRGLYKVSAVLGGTLDGSVPFVRSASHLMEVVNDDIALASVPAQLLSGASNATKLRLQVDVTGTSAPGSLYRAYAEVWAHHLMPKPVAWLGGYVEKQCETGGARCYVELELDAHWLKMAQVDLRKGLRLEHVYLSDYAAHVPLTQMAMIPVAPSPTDASSKAVLHNLVNLVSMLPRLHEPTESMRWGQRPAHLLPEAVEARRAAAKANGTDLPNLVLLHGWCAQQQPWSNEGFTNARLFEDYGQSRPTAEFAKLVVDATADLPSFGLIGHSQGGLVSTHIHNYFWTGLENAKGERKIQSVGTPYQGCTGAGSGADFIKVFGIGCGSNFDLSTDGAALWSAGIEESTRSDVYFYLTQWKDSGLIKYCKLAVNLLLKWPNDGATEIALGVLEGGNNMGITQGECHTLDMNFPPQYRDSARNKVMNDKAAR